VFIVNMSFIKHMAPQGPVPSPLTPPEQAAQEKGDLNSYAIVLTIKLK
jgi:hypothetical protein